MLRVEYWIPGWDEDDVHSCGDGWQLQPRCQTLSGGRRHPRGRQEGQVSSYRVPEAQGSKEYFYLGLWLEGMVSEPEQQQSVAHSLWERPDGLMAGIEIQATWEGELLQEPSEENQSTDNEEECPQEMSGSMASERCPHPWGGLWAAANTW